MIFFSKIFKKISQSNNKKSLLFLLFTYSIFGFSQTMEKKIDTVFITNYKKDSIISVIEKSIINYKKSINRKAQLKNIHYSTEINDREFINYKDLFSFSMDKKSHFKNFIIKKQDFIDNDFLKYFIDIGRLDYLKDYSKNYFFKDFSKYNLKMKITENEEFLITFFSIKNNLKLILLINNKTFLPSFLTFESITPQNVEQTINYGKEHITIQYTIDNIKNSIKYSNNDNILTADVIMELIDYSNLKITSTKRGLLKDNINIKNILKFE